MMPISAVSFDLDGTLAEIRWRKLHMWPAMMRHPRIMAALSPAIAARRGQRIVDLDAAIAADIAAAVGAPPEQVAAVMKAELDGRWPQLFAGAAVPGPVAAMLRACDAAGLPRVVVSDHPPLDKLAAMGLTGWSAATSCRALGALKPLPDGLLATAAQLGIPPSALLHIGDRWETDGLAAAAAGCPFLHIDQIDPQAPLRDFLDITPEQSPLQKLN